MSSCVTSAIKRVIYSSIDRNKKQENIVSIINGYNANNYRFTGIKAELEDLNKHGTVLKEGNTRGFIYGLAVFYIINKQNNPTDFTELQEFATTNQIDIKPLSGREVGYFNEFLATDECTKIDSVGGQIYNLKKIKEEISKKHPNVFHNNSQSEETISSDSEQSRLIQKKQRANTSCFGFLEKLLRKPIEKNLARVNGVKTYSRVELRNKLFPNDSKMKYIFRDITTKNNDAIEGIYANDNDINTCYIYKFIDICNDVEFGYKFGNHNDPSINKLVINEGIDAETQIKFKSELTRQEINAIFKNMPALNTEETFDKMLSITCYGNVLSEHTTITAGDIDGSIGRVILMGLQSGHIKFKNDDGYALLRKLLEAESNVIRNGTGLRDFQQDASYKEVLGQIRDLLKFQEGSIPLIFIGDIIHDRFSTDKDFMRLLVENLHKNKVIFIAGSHDLIPSSNDFHNIATQTKRNMKFGCYASTKHTYESWHDWTQRHFVNAYLLGRNLYIHNGIILPNIHNHDEYETAFGKIKAATPRDLVDQLNNTNPKTLKEFSGFRPSDTEINGTLAYNENFRGITIVHGHHGTYTEDHNVINLNSRIEEEVVLPCAGVIGERRQHVLRP